MDAPREPRTLKADRRARLALAVCAVGLFLLAAAMTALIPRGRSYLQGQEPRVSLRILQGLLASVFLSFLPIGGYMFWFGRRTVRSRQMPPPGTWVVRDTCVIEGDAAVRRGQAVMVFAAILSAVVLFGGLWLPYKFGKVFTRHLRQSTGQAGPIDSNLPAGNSAP